MSLSIATTQKGRIALTQRPYDELFNKALELACYYQNRCCDLEEIVELFCLDAEEKIK